MTHVRYAPVLEVVIEKKPALDVNIGNDVVVGMVPEYDGVYEVTPSDETQRLPTAGTQLKNDVIINPIPNNYGRIVWDGVTLRVF